jgi:hypothetical protein
VGPTARRAELVRRLNTAGIAGTTDPARLNPPDVAVLVEAVNLTDTIGVCAWNATVTVWLLAPASSAADALVALETRVCVVAQALGAVSARYTTHSQGQTQWPAYELSVPTTVTA